MMDYKWIYFKIKMTVLFKLIHNLMLLPYNVRNKNKNKLIKNLAKLLKIYNKCIKKLQNLSNNHNI